MPFAKQKGMTSKTCTAASDNNRKKLSSAVNKLVSIVIEFRITYLHLFEQSSKKHLIFLIEKRKQNENNMRFSTTIGTNKNSCSFSRIGAVLSRTSSMISREDIVGINPEILSRVIQIIRNINRSLKPFCYIYFIIKHGNSLLSLFIDCLVILFHALKEGHRLSNANNIKTSRTNNLDISHQFDFVEQCG